MATDVNLPLITVTGPSSGIRIGYLLKILTDGTGQRGNTRGFGGKPAQNGADTTSPAMHIGFTESFDDAWHCAYKNDIGSTAVRVDNLIPNVSASVLANRKKIFVRNSGSYSVWLGHNSNVTTTGATRGFELRPGEARWLPIAETLTVYAICKSGVTAGTLEVEQWA